MNQQIIIDKQQMSQILSPNLFLFQQLVIQVLQQAKKVIKIAPFDEINPTQLVMKTKKQSMEIFHHYFLIAMSSPRVRELACGNYEKLLRENLVQTNTVQQMITSILAACASGGSTTGSSMGSVSSTIIQGEQSVNVAKLISVILIKTRQSCSQITVGLNYLLEGTKSKLYGGFHALLLSEVYQNSLIYQRTPPIEKFLGMYLRSIVDEVSEHCQDTSYQYSLIVPSKSINQGFNQRGKFGLCFVCYKPANNYDKNTSLPLCSTQCKQKLTILNQQCKTNDYFNFLNWLMDHLPNHEIIYELLALQLPNVEVTMSQFQYIFKSLPQGIAISGHCCTIAKDIIKRVNYSPLSNNSVFHPIVHSFLQQLHTHLTNSLPTLSNISLIDFIAFMVKTPDLFFGVYQAYDCNLFEPNLLIQMLNIVSQYAMATQNDSKDQLNSNSIIGCRSMGVDTIYRMLIMLMQNLVEKQVEDLYTIDSQNVINKRKLETIISKFNHKPQKGIKQLKLLLPNISSKSIAIFIRQNVDYRSKLKKRLKINKVKLGQYFSSPSPEAIDVYTQFLKLIDFSGMDVDDVWRVLLQYFSLPKEGQQIERLLNTISEVFLEQSKLASTTAVYQFAFTAMMVQTNQNPNVREADKLNLKRFIDYCNLLVEGGVDEARATNVFNRISSNPFSNPYNYRNDELIYRKYIKWGYGDSCYAKKQCQQNVGIQIERQQQSLQGSTVEKETFQQSMEQSFYSGLKQQIKSNAQKSQNSFASKSQVSYVPNIPEVQVGQIWKRTSFLYRKCLLQYLWQYIYMSIVNQSNSKGLLEAVVLYGKYDLEDLSKGFFTALSKLSQKGSLQSHQNILRLATNYGNYLGRYQWSYIIKMVYELQESSSVHTQFQSQSKISRVGDIIDKIFTKSQSLNPKQLSIFLQQLCQFSSSQFKKDVKYNRQLFVLRHITEVTQYNLPRLDNMLWNILWPTLNRYFINICLHPRKQISMAAIDSYKQLLMKIIRLQTPLPVSPMLEIYNHVFQRSNSLIRDLIVNILLNIINPKMNDGYQAIYAILEHADCEDRKTVMKVVGRMIDDIGLDNLPLLPRLHDILIRELRLAEQSMNIDMILERVWEVANHIDNLNVWLDTLRSVKDIYKKTTNSSLVEIFYGLANRALRTTEVQDIHEQVFIQVIDLGYFFVQIRDRKTLEIGLNESKKLSEKHMMYFLSGQSGILFLWKTYLQSPNKLIFSLYLKEYIPVLLNVMIQYEKDNKQKNQMQEYGSTKILNWVLKNFQQFCPKEILQLKQLDADFKMEINNLQPTEVKPQLIEFTLSSRQFHLKAMIHLMILDIIDSIYSNHVFQKIHTTNEVKNSLQLSFQQIIISTYQIAVQTNKLVALRYFLWKNNFLALNTKTKKGISQALPGLHKLQSRLLTIMIHYIPPQTIFLYVLNYFTLYQSNISLNLKQNEQSNNLIIMAFRDIKTWIKNASNTILLIIKWFKQNCHKRQIIDINNIKIINEGCIKLLQFPTEQKILNSLCDLMDCLVDYVIKENQR